MQQFGTNLAGTGAYAEIFQGGVEIFLYGQENLGGLGFFS